MGFLGTLFFFQLVHEFRATPVANQRPRVCFGGESKVFILFGQFKLVESRLNSAQSAQNSTNFENPNFSDNQTSYTKKITLQRPGSLFLSHSSKGQLNSEL